MNQLARSRRLFLTTAAMAAASLGKPWLLRAAGLPARYARADFEVASSLYAWELHDERIETILDNLQQMAEVNSVYLIALMHYERRPFTGPSFPHDPVRKMWQAEDSRVYWHPEMKRYGRIKPMLSDFAWLNRTDWLRVLVQAAGKRHLKAGAEISHTVLNLERAQGEFADCVQQDIHGQPRSIPGQGRGYPICPNNPDAQQYVLALFSDMAANYGVNFLQTCLTPFMPGGAGTGGCFCKSCMRAAKAHDVDLARIRKVLLANPQAPAELAQWQAFRQASLVQFYKMMHHGIHAIRPDVEFRWNDEFFADHETWGVDLKGLSRQVDSIRVSEYSEQKGDPALMGQKREWLTAEKRATGPAFPMLSGVAVRPKATPALVREGIKIAAECGMNGISLAHYDGAEFPVLRSVREGLNAAKVRVPHTLS